MKKTKTNFRKLKTKKHMAIQNWLVRHGKDEKKRTDEEKYEIERLREEYWQICQMELDLYKRKHGISCYGF